MGAKNAKRRLTGVSRNGTNGTFVANIRWEGKTIKLGSWSRETDAAIAFDRASLGFGRDGPLNLPAKSRALGPASPEDLRRAARMQAKIERGGASQFRGVTWHEASNEWRVRVRVDGVVETAAGFASEEEAAIAFDRLLLGLGGDRAKLNFPRRRHAAVSVSELRAELHARRKSKLTSKYRGVNLGPNGRWHAEIHAAGRHCRLGQWLDERDAAKAYDRAALFFRGAAALRNFPSRALEPTSPADLRAEAQALLKATRSSRYRGVTRVEGRGYREWRAEIVRNRRLHTIGGFETEREAAIAFDRVARAWFGEEATLNFPAEPWPAASLEEVRREHRARYKQTTTSRYAGVSWKMDAAAWVAGIAVDHVYYFLGYHDEEEAAARAYDRKRWELRGEGPYNFPGDVPDG